jgi:hypothetical protein
LDNTQRKKRKTTTMMRALHHAFGAALIGALLIGSAGCPAPAATGSTISTKPASGAKKGIPAEKKHAVPDDWQEMADAAKGYSFHVPAGTTATSKSLGGVDFYFAQTPQPHNIEVLVAAFKNKSLSREDLLKEATGALSALGNTQINVGAVVPIGADYGLAEMTMVDDSSVRYKTLVLVATDITDNYVMIIGTPEADFAKNRDTLDAMWSSFEMWSGGASGDG